MRKSTLDVPRVDIAGSLGVLAGSKRARDWTDGKMSIPRGPSLRRKQYDKQYLEAVEERFGGPNFKLSPMLVSVPLLVKTNLAVNRERYDLYKRMLSAGDDVPPIVVEPMGDAFRILDGNHRTQAAMDVNVFFLPALLREQTQKGRKK